METAYDEKSEAKLPGQSQSSTVKRGDKGRRGEKGQKWGKFLAFKYYAIA